MHEKFILADTHCHLDFEAYETDRQQVLERSRQAGVQRILNPGIDLPSSRAAIRLAEEHPEVYAAVGVHPNSALEWDKSSLEELRDLAGHPKVVAIGEIGLDFYRDRAPREIQARAFEEQLELAASLALPVIIHNRQATLQVHKMLQNWTGALEASSSPLNDRHGVLHSFSGDVQEARHAIRLGFYVGITGPVTYRNAAALQEVVADLPADRLLVETDAPFLPPHPHRGERNEPVYVRLIVDKIAEIQSLSTGILAARTTSNAERLFNWGVPD